jgi:hypothetical protein
MAIIFKTHHQILYKPVCQSLLFPLRMPPLPKSLDFCHNKHQNQLLILDFESAIYHTFKPHLIGFLGIYGLTGQISPFVLHHSFVNCHILLQIPLPFVHTSYSINQPSCLMHLVKVWRTVVFSIRQRIGDVQTSGQCHKPFPCK